MKDRFRLLHPALLAPLLWSTQPGAAATGDLPPALFEFTEQAFLACQTAGGQASIGSGYQTGADLNGDGTMDYVTDSSAMDCAGAPGTFCDGDACAVQAWLSAPDGSYDRIELGAPLSFELIENTADQTVIRTSHDPALCVERGLESTTCTRTWNLHNGDAATPEFDRSVVTVPPPRPSDLTPVEIETLLDPDAAADAGWTLRAVPGASPVALSFGPGNVYNLAAFCLGKAPFIAVRFRDPPAQDSLSLNFTFDDTPIEVEALLEETAGGAFIIDLDENSLASRLSGNGLSTVISVDGQEQGTMSLRGSTRSIRTALESCFAF